MLRTRISVWILAAIGLLASALEAQDKAVCLIRGSDGRAGSGCFVSPQHVLTAYHVVDAPAIRVEFGSVIYPARIIKSDEKRDLALITIDRDIKVDFLTIAQPPKIGDKITFWGHPGGIWEVQHLDGQINEIVTITNTGARQAKITPAANFGYSGGPVTNLKGEICAVVLTITIINGQKLNTYASIEPELVMP